MDNADLMEVMLPVIKADFWVADTYIYQETPPLSCPIVAFGSEHDPEVPLSELDAWGRHTSADFAVHRMPGDHFFVHSARDQLLSAVSAELRAHRTVRSGPPRRPLA
jgi:medium-chain acyl-[acyl-carrier-protein] hydrolase